MHPRGLLFPAFALLVGLVATPAHATLNCQAVRQLVGFYFKMHYQQHNFDDELSRRTLDSYLKAWDAGKVYFLKADIDALEKKYATKLDDMVMDANCKAIEEVVRLFSQRFDERQKVINAQIAAKHDFSIDEYMPIDRKKMDYATTTEEVTERWRQRIKFQLLQLKGTMGDVEKAKEKLTKRYQLAEKRHRELTSDDMYSTFLNAFSSSLDPHSEYLPPEQLEDFRISTKLSLEGIGAVLRTEDGFTTIQSLVPGGAASKTGKVKVNDKIIAVAQGEEPPVDVIDMDLREVVKLIRGARSTEVRLTLVREVESKTVQLVVPIIREQIQLKDRAAKSQVYSVNVAEGTTPRLYKVGVIELPSFYMDFEGRQNREKGYRSSADDMLAEINKLKAANVDAMIVDLRSNGGGSLDASIDIAGMFFDKGPVVQIKDMRGSILVHKDEDGDTQYKGPLIVMINRQSASASEIFAGAIQDYQRGLIVGDTHTFGKGTVQNLNDIDEKLGAIKVTISKFYRPSGSSTQLKGVESDIVLPDVLDQYEIGEKYYDYALPWEKIKDSDYRKTASVVPAPALKKMRDASAERVKGDKGFTKVFEAIAEYKKSEAERSRVPLKEDLVKKDDKKEKDKASVDPDDEEADKLPLTEDFQLQETLRIAGDYLQLLNKHDLGKVALPDLDKAIAAQSAREKKTGSTP